MMFYVFDLGEDKVLVGFESNGFVGKKVKFIGKEFYVGFVLYDGINVLNVVMFVINNVNVFREIFKEFERVRFYFIIIKGGDIVNVVFVDVYMELYVRVRIINGMIDVNERINKVLMVGGMVVGVDVEIIEIFGYFLIL